MKKLTNILCIAVIAGALFQDKISDFLPESLDVASWFQSGKNDINLIKPSDLHGFDSSIPSVLKDKAAATRLTGLFTGMADELEHDGDRAKPEIRYAANVRDALRESVNLKFDGKKLNELAPGLGDKIGPEFEKVMPDGTAELDATTRKKAVELFRAAAYGCSLVK